MNTDAIKQLIEDLLRHMQIAVQSIEVSESDGRKRFAVSTTDSHLLIGAKGANLSAFNHLVKKIASAKSAPRMTEKGETSPVSPTEGEHTQTFFVDVNGYQEAALISVKNIAKVMGDRARSFKTSVELEPMSSYERMIIHAFFQETKDLKTESVGEGERRRVVIKYVEDQALGN
ncbi:MAG: R3H domain-containing nucleic acid-binding protein [bacterium]|nr:R3H domain-containing nucleic acid-binding protein [bacterium]